MVRTGSETDKLANKSDRFQCLCYQFIFTVVVLRSRENAQRLHDEGLAFVKAYIALSSINIRQKKQMFLLKPKLHVLCCAIVTALS